MSGRPKTSWASDLADALGNRYGPMVYVGAVMGLRWGEVAAFRVSSIDFLRRSIAVDEGVSRDERGRTMIGEPKSDASRRRQCVAALRVLAFADGPIAVDGVLRGLDDPVKRVRDVAAKSSVRFLDDERVIARLRRAVEDNETGSAGPALGILSGMYTSPYGLTALEPVGEAVASLARVVRVRRSVLVALLRTRNLTDQTTALLNDFVEDGTKEEAVMATRRLCGLRVARREELSDDQRRRAERAWGDLWFWVPTT